MTALLVVVGAVAGAPLRYLTDLAVPSRPDSVFPWGTLAVNAGGSLVLGAVAGLGYGVLAVAARVLPGFSPQHLIRDPAAYALAGAGIVSFMLYATALEDGSVTVATAAVVLAETTPPAVVGVMFLGDHTRAGLGGGALLGFTPPMGCAAAPGTLRGGGRVRSGAAAASRPRGRAGRAGRRAPRRSSRPTPGPRPTSRSTAPTSLRAPWGRSSTLACPPSTPTA